MIIYGICLVLGLVFALFSAIAGHFFGGHDGDVGTGGHAESGFDHTGVPGLSFFSPTVLACFVTAFGACGLVLSSIPSTNSVWISAPISMIVGVLLAFVAFLFFNTMFRKTQSSSESNVATVIGLTASIVSPIPENGVGEIAYIQGGSRYTAPARSEKGIAIPNGKPVRVTRILGTQFYVEVVS